MSFFTMVQFIWFNFFLITTGHFITSVQSINKIEDPSPYFYAYHDQNVTFRVYYKHELVDAKVIARVNSNYNNKYWLSTRRSHIFHSEELVYNDTNMITDSTFDKNKVTVFVIHGWGGNRRSSMNYLLKTGLLSVEDVNVIVVDWGEVASSNYLTCMFSVPAVGRDVGKFIKWLTTLGVSFDKVHIIGHSLGAHVAGNAGRETGSKVRRITGLDPAGPLWNISPHRLVKSDAQYVEIIHTNTRCLGYKGICGDADFFPNGGADMPGCIHSSCSHACAVRYMYDTILYNNYTAYRCLNMKEVYLNKCTGTPYLMGSNDLTKNRTGAYRLNTYKASRKNVEFTNGSSGYQRFPNSFNGSDCTVSCDITSA